MAERQFACPDCGSTEGFFARVCVHALERRPFKKFIVANRAGADSELQKVKSNIGGKISSNALNVALAEPPSNARRLCGWHLRLSGEPRSRGRAFAPYVQPRGLCDKSN
jgi:hypothetical protein